MKTTLAAALSVGIVLSDASAAHALSSSTPMHIQNLQGCFRVSYRFVEDGKHDYDIKDALEWITLREQSGAYFIQHYGVFGTEIGQHFNETWSLLSLTLANFAQAHRPRGMWNIGSFSTIS